MHIEYKSKKWDKEISKLNKVKKTYNNEYYRNIKNLYVNTSKSKDYVKFYGCCTGDFRIVARSFFLDGDYQKTIDNTFLAAQSWILFKKYLDEGSNTNFVNIERTLSATEFIMCLFIAVDQVEEYVKDYDSIMIHLHYGRREQAAIMIENIPEDDGTRNSIYYNEPFFLKKIYTAILKHDSKAFNEGLIKRIKKYRKNMVGYSTIIDYTSIALIKVAKKFGIEILVDVVEIPQFFFDKIVIDERIKKCLLVENV